LSGSRPTAAHHLSERSSCRSDEVCPGHSKHCKTDGKTKIKWLHRSVRYMCARQQQLAKKKITPEKKAPAAPFKKQKLV